MNSFKLHNMLLGASSAATQIEGDCTNTNWYDWYLKGHIKDNSSPEKANRHYKYFKEDIELMKQMGLQIARIGLEWARIEPQEGVFDEEVLEHYKEELKLMNANGIKPLVSLWHFSNPLWFEKKGGFFCKDARGLFLDYVSKVVSHLGEYIESWVTLNEPNVYGFLSYFVGAWPPGKKSLLKYIKLMDIFNELHIESYNMIHRCYPDAKVGTALHVRAYEPFDDSKQNIYMKNFAEALMQKNLAKSMNTGKVAIPFKNHKEGKYYDFIGINYYTRSLVKGFNECTKENTPKNDLGWEIYPEGLRLLCEEYHNEYQAPIYITENGTCDNEDKFRCLFLYDHLKQISDLDYVERYYHWCFIDNWEWVEGEKARFGLIHNDYDNQIRTFKKSGYFYKEIINENGINEDMYERYVKDEKYNIY